MVERPVSVEVVVGGMGGELSGEAREFQLLGRSSKRKTGEEAQLSHVLPRRHRVGHISS